MKTTRVTRKAWPRVNLQNISRISTQRISIAAREACPMPEIQEIGVLKIW